MAGLTGAQWFLRIHSAVSLLATVAFFVGAALRSPALWGFGAVVLIVDDVISILSGVLNPMFPVVKAVVLGALVHPVLLGLGWSVAPFALLNIRHHLRIFARPPTLTDD